MAISETDLKLLKSERMTDFSDGGGKMTGVEVVDGLVNNIFNDISQLDRTYGRVSLRKVYMGVLTANTDTYLGSHVILTDPPDDPNINITAFTTANWTDERSAARNRIESYSVQGPESDWVLYSDHVEGQKMIRVFSISNADSLTKPAAVASFQVGDVILLSQDKAGYTAQQQYFRITKIDSRETHLYTDANVNFYKDILIFEVSTALTATYYGASMTRFSIHGSPTLVRTVSVADAAQYFGVKNITESLAVNDMTIKVNSPYSALVPSAQAEVPLVDIVAGMGKINYKQSGLTNALTQSASLAGSAAPDYADDCYLGRGFKPLSLTLTIGGVSYRDDGAGNLVLANGSAGSYGGVVTYSSGHVRITKASSWNAAISATATAAVALYDNALTRSIPVTINNRAYNYVQTLSPAPTQNSLSVDFKALDKWYRLFDDGNGHLSGSSGGIGAGTVDYATGSVIVTLGALPDIDSAVIFSWATPLTYTMQTSVLNPPAPQIHVTLTDAPVAPGSLSITWTNSGSKTATDSGGAGNISGDATGKIVYETGKVVFSPALIPPPNTVFHIAWNQNLSELETFTVTGDSYGVIGFTLSQTPVKPGSAYFTYQVTVPLSDSGFNLGFGGFALPSVNRQRAAHDNGANVMINEVGTAIGTINYATGAVTFDSTDLIQVNKYVGMGGYSYWAWIYPGYGDKDEYRQIFVAIPVYVPMEVTQNLTASTTLTAHYVLNATETTAKTSDVAVTGLVIDLTTSTNDNIIANSIKFTFAGTPYIDRSGNVYRAHDNLTDSATMAGTIDYQTGLVALTDWVAGSNTLILQGLVSTPGAAFTTTVSYRTPGAPLATGQFQISAVTQKGDNITASANNNGIISSEWITGTIDWLSGVGSAAFGKRMLDSALPSAAKAESWYNAANIDAEGKIWTPMLVKPETIKFNTVLVSYIPLDASILGVETVRLPQDGRVPVFRIGNVAVVHNTQNLNLPNPAIAGTTYDCGRTLLSYAKAFDANGLIIPTAKYTANLDAGTVTMANPLVLTGYVQPLRIEHRIEDMALITDVQITGQVQLMKPVRHAYPANSSFLSSALVISDLQGRVTGLFDQATWTSVFSDLLIGSPATVSFNDVLYPLIVTNAGTIQERWALVFTGSTAFNCYGEYSGLVAQGNTGVNFAPINPIASTPYFTINYLGWGTGWASGNVLRFNTVAANYPLWLARTTLQSDPAVYTDNFKIQIRGDAN
jgi:hypothetical protein